MRYTDFRDRIWDHLRRRPAGRTWAELKQALRLPYDRPCPTWVKRLEGEIGLVRAAKKGPALLWQVRGPA